MHALWAIKKMKLEHLVPDLEIQLQQDFSWWENYYAPGLEILPPDLREIIQNNLELYLQLLEDSSHLTSIDLFPE